MIRFFDEPDFFNFTTEFKGKVNLDNINITGGTISGITDLAIADGGTGASTAATAVGNLLNGTALSTATVATDDKVLIQDTDDSDNLKTVTVASIAALSTDTFATIEVDGTPVSTAAPTLDFDSTDFLLTESPTDSFDITIVDSGIDHDALTNFVANEHIDWTSTTSAFSTSGTAATGALTTTGNIIVTGTVDGRDIATDGTKLDGIPTTRPSFRAYLSSAQSISSGVATKIQLNTETFDTNSNYDPTTNYRFTPTVAGKYVVSSGLTITSTSATFTIANFIYKNGVAITQPEALQAWIGGIVSVNCSDIVDMNGSTDYLEFYGYQDSGISRALLTNSRHTYAAASLVI